MGKQRYTKEVQHNRNLVKEFFKGCCVIAQTGNSIGAMTTYCLLMEKLLDPISISMQSCTHLNKRRTKRHGVFSGKT
jgi:hypothetical protein